MHIEQFYFPFRDVRFKCGLVPEKEAPAPGLKPDDSLTEVNEAFPDEEHAGVTLQGESGELTRSLSFTFQQLVDVLLQKQLTHRSTNMNIMTRLPMGHKNINKRVDIGAIYDT